MQTLDQDNKRAADLYWLAFLLTGRCEASVGATIEALDSEDGANPFFSTWMVAWSRRVLIAKALTAVRDELAASARRTASRRAPKSPLPPANWTLDGGTTKAELERALLAIDIFPRCALLLSVFEGMSLEDASVLLDADRDLVHHARMIGLHELTCNMAGTQASPRISIDSWFITSETQHA